MNGSAVITFTRAELDDERLRVAAEHYSESGEYVLILTNDGDDYHYVRKDVLESTERSIVRRQALSLLIPGYATDGLR